MAGEEDPAMLMADLGENGRVIGIRGEVGRRRVAGPGAGGAVLHEGSFPTMRRVAVMMLVVRWRPFDPKGDPARHGRAAGNGIYEVEVIRQGQVMGLINRPPAAWIDVDGV